MCAKCYRYWLDHTPAAERPTAPRFARNFWDFVTKTHAQGCWKWTGPVDRKGYGRWGKEVASRHSWELANGPIEGGLWVLHHCDNPPCVNPAHLYLGTVVENAQDMVARQRGYIPPLKAVCDAGHAIEGDNLRVITSGTQVIRRCRKCDNARSAKWQRERRQARGLRKTQLTDGERARILALRGGGMSQRKIATEVGRSLVTVQRALKVAS